MADAEQVPDAEAPRPRRLMDRVGSEIRTIQELISHKGVKTTMDYTLIIGENSGRSVTSWKKI